MTEKEKEEPVKCLNCNDPIVDEDRPFMYDSPHFCSGPCKDSYIRKISRGSK